MMQEVNFEYTTSRGLELRASRKAQTAMASVKTAPNLAYQISYSQIQQNKSNIYLIYIYDQKCMMPNIIKIRHGRWQKLKKNDVKM